MVIMMKSTVEYLANINPDFAARFMANVPVKRTRDGNVYIILEEFDSYKEKQQF